MTENNADAQTVVITTSKGVIEAELNAAKAPITVKNFLSYVDAKYFDGLIFHRVIKSFMIQGGGMTPDMKEKDSKSAPIKLEVDTGLKNSRGTLAMARTGDPDSATSQFFINLVDNRFLDYKASMGAANGYAVFGTVTKGLDVVDAIAAVETKKTGSHDDVPVEPVIIKSITRK